MYRFSPPSGERISMVGSGVGVGVGVKLGVGVGVGVGSGLIVKFVLPSKVPGMATPAP